MTVLDDLISASVASSLPEFWQALQHEDLVDVDLEDDNGHTALSRVCLVASHTIGHKEVIQALLAKGADPELPASADEIIPIECTVPDDVRSWFVAKVAQGANWVPPSAIVQRRLKLSSAAVYAEFHGGSTVTTDPRKQPAPAPTPTKPAVEYPTPWQYADGSPLPSTSHGSRQSPPGPSQMSLEGDRPAGPSTTTSTARSSAPATYAPYTGPLPPPGWNDFPGPIPCAHFFLRACHQDGCRFSHSIPPGFHHSALPAHHIPPPALVKRESTPVRPSNSRRSSPAAPPRQSPAPAHYGESRRRQDSASSTAGPGRQYSPPRRHPPSDARSMSPSRRDERNGRESYDDRSRRPAPTVEYERRDRERDWRLSSPPSRPEPRDRREPARRDDRDDRYDRHERERDPDRERDRDRDRRRSRSPPPRPRRPRSPSPLPPPPPRRHRSPSPLSRQRPPSPPYLDGPTFDSKYKTTLCHMGCGLSTRSCRFAHSVEEKRWYSERQQRPAAAGTATNQTPMGATNRYANGAARTPTTATAPLTNGVYPAEPPKVDVSELRPLNLTEEDLQTIIAALTEPDSNRPRSLDASLAYRQTDVETAKRCLADPTPRFDEPAQEERYRSYLKMCAFGEPAYIKAVLDYVAANNEQIAKYCRWAREAADKERGVVEKAGPGYDEHGGLEAIRRQAQVNGMDGVEMMGSRSTMAFDTSNELRMSMNGR